MPTTNLLFNYLDDIQYFTRKHVPTHFYPAKIQFIPGRLCIYWIIVARPIVEDGKHYEDAMRSLMALLREVIAVNAQHAHHLKQEKITVYRTEYSHEENMLTIELVVPHHYPPISNLLDSAGIEDSLSLIINRLPHE
jgi:hypothetical protein